MYKRDFTVHDYSDEPYNFEKYYFNLSKNDFGVPQEILT